LKVVIILIVGKLGKSSRRFLTVNDLGAGGVPVAVGIRGGSDNLSRMEATFGKAEANQG
jgi:hypothetical protein